MQEYLLMVRLQMNLILCNVIFSSYLESYLETFMGVTTIIANIY